MIIYSNNLEYMKELTIEQKIIKHLATQHQITEVGLVAAALKDNDIAKRVITGDDIPGIENEIKDAIENGEIEGVGGDCNHEALTNPEIQEVFDNDEE